MMWLESSEVDSGLLLEVAAIRREAEQVRSLELRDPAGAELPPFEAGAHVRVEVELPDGRKALRHYSLLNDPGDRFAYRIGVQLEPYGRGGSAYLHHRVSEGRLLRVQPPVNAFPLSREARHTLLIAGGIGITPLLAMARELDREHRSFELHYAARTLDRMAFRSEIEQFAGKRAVFHFDQTENPNPLDLAALLAAPADGSHVYVCGPGGMIRAVRSLAERNGWPASRIHFESFGPKQRPDDHPIDVRLERSGITVHVGAGETILDAILAAGVWATYDCRRGECASCMTDVLHGEPDHRDVCLSETMRQRYLCTCVSRAFGGELVLDL